MAVPSEFVHVGYGGTVAVQRVLAIATPDSSPIKRMIKLANKESRLINECCSPGSVGSGF